METKIFTVPNISCGHCVASIQNELSEQPGVQSVAGDPTARTITVAWQDPATEASIRAVLTDINYPADGNWLGTMLTRYWQMSGDIIRDIDRILVAHELKYEDKEIGGFGSVHMYVCRKN